MKSSLPGTFGPDNPPVSPAELLRFVRDIMGVSLSTHALLAGNTSQLDYVAHSFFLGAPPAWGLRPAPTPDCVVWTNRGGGKTFLGAVATALDLYFKPGIEVRILGGSLEQSRRMHAHLRRLFDPSVSPALAAEVRGRMTDRRLSLRNGATVELLAQSETSVRGTRVQVLRCDEVDLFKEQVWHAAQLTTRARRCGAFLAPGHVECLSTMQVPHGVMHALVREAAEGRRRLMRWSVVDVLEKCGEERSCGGGDPASGVRAPRDGECALRPECRGRAKQFSGGHLTIEEVIAMKRRVPLRVWSAEMLCLRPTRSRAVLAEFDPVRHVFTGEPPPGPLAWVGGMDLGVRSPGVVLWACLDSTDVLRIMDERCASGEGIEQHARAIRAGLARPGVPAWPPLQWIAVDPSGESAGIDTGRSPATAMRDLGIRVRSPRLKIQPGLSMIRARLAPADGARPRLLVHARCATLIECMERYHYRSDLPEDCTPVKDGFDHAVDALRYLVTQLDRGFKNQVGDYIDAPAIGGR